MFAYSNSSQTRRVRDNMFESLVYDRLVSRYMSNPEEELVREKCRTM